MNIADKTEKVELQWKLSDLILILDECLPGPMTEPEKHLVKILELVQIEKYVPVSAKRQWLGRRLKEREALAGAFIAKSILRYPHTSSLRHALLSPPNLRMIRGFSKRRDVPSEAAFSRAFAEYARAGLGTVIHDALVREPPCVRIDVASLRETLSEPRGAESEIT
ncbi:MAG: hypothetical protein RBT64_10125 [Trichloromonas sp.]|nr:hypothetical protein [Trichloromonas sp.]